MKIKYEHESDIQILFYVFNLKLNYANIINH